MTSKVPRKPQHLFVVKDSTITSEARILGPENLSGEQQAAVQRYMKLANTSGVLVGAVAGSGAWDLRPLLFESGILVQIRFSDPAFVFHRMRFTSLRAVHLRLAGTAPGPAILGHGEAEGQLYIKRRFYQATLEDSEAGIAVLALQRLISAVRSLHRSGIFHGHISPSNVAIEQGTPVLLDHGFGAAMVEARLDYLAPEIVAGNPAAAPADVYGLGAIIKNFFQSSLGGDQAKFLETMIASDPATRPSIDQVEATFGSASVPASSSTPEARSPVGGAPRSGRLITPNAVSRPVPPTYRSPEPLPPQRTELPRTELPRTELPRNEGLRREAAPQPPPGPPEAVPSESPARPTPVAVSNESPPESSIPPQNSPPPSAPTREMPPPRPSSLMPMFVALLLGGVAIGGTMYGPALVNRVFSGPEDAAHFDTYWKSGQPSMMQQVARSAIERPEGLARVTIVTDAMSGNKRASVRTELLKIGFDPAWESELSENDRQILLRLALSQLIPAELKSLPPLSSAHPGVALAIIGEMPIDGAAPSLKEVPVSKMEALPAPYGPSFKGLEALGVTTMEQPVARALSHLIIGDVSDKTVGSLFDSRDESAVTFIKLRSVAPFFATSTNLSEIVYNHLSNSGSMLALVLQWFGAEEGAGWDKVERKDKLGITAGIVPEGLSFEQYADLLKFPNSAVRPEAAKRLLLNGTVPASMSQTLAFLTSKANGFSRTQTILLLAALRLQGENGHPFIAKWFGTKPDPHAVLAILLSRNAVQKLDVFNVEAARYLASNEWSASIDELRRLSVHPEALARTLAYAKLNPAVPEEMAILSNMAKVEPNARIRAQIQERLDGRSLGEQGQKVEEKTPNIPPFTLEASPDAAPNANSQKEVGDKVADGAAPQTSTAADKPAPAPKRRTAPRRPNVHAGRATKKSGEPGLTTKPSEKGDGASPAKKDGDAPAPVPPKTKREQFDF